MTDHFPQIGDVSSGGLAKDCLEFCEGVLDWVEVGRVGRQVEQPGACRLDEAADVGDLVSRGVRPWRWTELSGCFDRLPGVLVFELRGAEIA